MAKEIAMEQDRAIESAITLLKAAGYRITKPRQRQRGTTGLNAIGRPYGPNYDPHYKIRTPLTSIARLRAPMPKDTQWAS